MEIGNFKKGMSLVILFLVPILLFATGCETKEPKDYVRINKKPERLNDLFFDTYANKNDPYYKRQKHQHQKMEDLIPGISDLSEEEQLNQFVRHSIDMMEDILPVAQAAEKDKIRGLVEQLRNIEKQGPDFFDNGDNLIDFSKIFMGMHVLLADMEPENFQANYHKAYAYDSVAAMIKNVSEAPERDKLIGEYESKALQAAKDLVKRFPDQAKAYHQLGFFYYQIEHDKKKAMGMFNRCLELDPKSELCRSSYNNLKN